MKLAALAFDDMRDALYNLHKTLIRCCQCWQNVALPNAQHSVDVQP